MATIREYYEKDFGHSTRIYVRVPINGELIEGAILYDFAGFCAFVALYVTGKDRKPDFFINLLSQLDYGRSQLQFDGRVQLPLTREFPGQLRIENKPDFEILAQYFGDTEWISTKNIQASRRVFIYSETDLSLNEIDLLKRKARELNHELQFRSERFRQERSKHEKPLAFISHDSRDKDIVAKKIAVNLQRMLCPVWYDEFSLKIGDNLRESIEKGLKECKKCILVLSTNFISNKGWTKTEFDSIFTRQILEEQKLVLPVWYRVTKQDIYDYSPSLLNVKGADWEQLSEEEVCRQLYNAITSD
jgi:hypothetical protein